jgi:hypothetical protein
MPLLVMPSPSGRNLAGAVIHSATATGRALLAMDAMLTTFPSGSKFPSGDNGSAAVPNGQREVAVDQHAALRRACSDAGLDDVVTEKIIAALAEGAQDQPPPFHGMPTPGGGQVPLDRALDGLPKWQRKQLRRQLAQVGADRLAIDGKRQRDLAPSSKDLEGFYSRFPGVRKIGILG